MAKRRAVRIPFDDDGLTLQRPSNTELGVVPLQRALVLSRVVIGRLVEDFGVLGEDKEAVREARRNPRHAPGGGIEIECHRPAESRGAAPEIDRNVEHLSDGDANELALRLAHLVVQTTQYAALRPGMIVL